MEKELEQMEDPATLRERMNQLNAEVMRLKEKRDEIQGPLDETQAHRQDLFHQRQSVVTVLRKLTNTMEHQYQHIKRIDEVRSEEVNNRLESLSGISMGPNKQIQISSCCVWSNFE